MELKECFDEIDIEKIPRDENSHVDALANLSVAIQVTERKKIPIIYLKCSVMWK